MHDGNAFFQKTPQVVSLLPEKQAEVTAKGLFCFLSELCEWSQSCPLVYRGGLDRGKVIYLCSVICFFR